MKLAAAARIGAYLLAMLAAAGAPALVGHAAPQATGAGWREPLKRAEGALASGDARAAQESWEHASRAAIQARATEGLLAVGDAYLRIGEAARDRSTAVAGARGLYLRALLLAREHRDGSAVAAAAAAFASLGDRDVADRGFEIATSIAPRQGDVAVQERIAALRMTAANTRPTR